MKAIKDYLLNWFNKNYRHVLVALILFVMTMLYKLGYITQDQVTIITGVLAALGISLTTNSGTVERVVSIQNAKENGGVTNAVPVKASDTIK